MVAPAFAQDTTSAVGGRITNQDGKSIAGAQVSILHIESGSVVNTNTNADGRYLAKGLRVGGPYKVTVSKDGATESRDNLYFDLGQEMEVSLVLGVAATEKIEVTSKRASDKFNKNTMGASTSVTRRDIENLASINRNLQDYARTDPRLAQASKDRGEVTVMGQNARYNSITVDGVTISDTFGLESNNLPTAKQPISIEAIQSVQVNVANFDVTQAGYTGANINAVTKSGTNDFHGSVYGTYRNDSMAGDRFNRATQTYFAPPSFKEETKGFTFGGPIIKDKLFFFTDYEEFVSSRNTPSYAPMGTSTGGTTVGITPTAVAGAQQIASQYGINAGTFDGGNANLKVKDYLARLDWNINADHRAFLRYSRTEQSEPIYPNFSSNQLALNSDWYTQDKTIQTVVAQWFANWSDSFNTEAKVSVRDYDSNPKNNTTLPLVQLGFTGPLPIGAPAGTDSSKRTLYLGTERSRQFNTLSTHTLDGYFAGHVLLGEHELKLGTDFSRNEIENGFLQDTYGNYTFGCINSTASFTYSFGSVNCGTANAATIEQATLENFRRGRPSSFTVQAANPGYQLSDGKANWTLTNTGLFAQDSWTFNPNLNLMAGLRYDRLTTGDHPYANAAAAAPTVAGVVATGTRQSGGFGRDNTLNIDGADLIQPRVGFNFHFKKELQTQVRGGVGLFQGASANVWLTNPYQNTGIPTRIVGCGTLGFPACPSTDGLFNPNPNAQPTTLAGAAPAANVDYIEPGLHQPSIWKANLAIEQELPWGGLVFSAEDIYSSVNDGVYYRHLNLGAATRQGLDGRDLFYTAQGYNTACWTDTGASISNGACTGFRSRALSNPGFNNVLLAAKTHGGDGNSLTLQLSKPFSKGFGWSLAYTRTEATEVSNLSSSVSNSNWAARASFNPNEDVAATSTSQIKDRINGTLNFERVFFANLKTKIGMFFEGRSGRPYSWTYGNDMNGDGVTGNDLMFVPSGPQSGQVVFRGDTASNHPNEDRFWSIVNANDGLRSAKGGVVKRNNDRSGWVNSIDMRVTQELPAFRHEDKAEIAFDFLNIGNMLNKKWGRIDEVDFQGSGGYIRSLVNFAGVDAQGRYIYTVMQSPTDLVTRQNKGESQWAVQATMRYSF
jgi:hypothetical protein